MKESKFNQEKALKLALEVIRVLDKRAKRGCDSPSWIGYENGEGYEVGRDIERLITRAKRYARNYPAGSAPTSLTDG